MKVEELKVSIEKKGDLKIWFPQVHTLSGGPRTFMFYFQEIAPRFNVELVSNPHRAEVLFGLNDWIPINIIRRCKQINIPYLHRANGVFRPILKDFPDWKERNERLKPHYELADKVIFQSEFAKKSYFEYVGRCDKWKIIYNGVDIEKFHPCLRNKEPSKVGLLGRPLTKMQEVWRAAVKEEFDVVETFKWDKSKDIRWAFKDMKIAIFPDEQSCCPNEMLEAMACGIPVLAWEGSGAAELTEKSLVVNKNNYLYKINEIYYESKKYSGMVRNLVEEKFNIVDRISAYVKEMRKLCLSVMSC